MPVSASTAPVNSDVNFVRPEVQNSSKRWDVVRDCLGGSEAVKAKGPTYLPVPNAGDTSPANQARYQQYKERAIFYNVTKRTIEGWIGQVFSRDPLCEIPDGMDDLYDDISGDGVSLDQQAKLALGYNMAYGRGGLLVDYPSVSGPMTIAEVKAGNIRPTIHLYEASDIINWRTIKIGAQVVPNLIVLKERSATQSDGFSFEEQPQFRVLRLIQTTEGYAYTIEVWNQGEDKEWVKGPTSVVRGPNGKPVERILFYPFTSSGNNFACPFAPAYDLAMLNIGHYRNSADYEESCFIVGQPTPVFAGLTQEWVDEVFKGSVELGSRAAVPLPVGGTAMLLQVNPNTMTKEAMVHKEAQMVAIGARIIKDDSVQKTLGESQMEEATDSSVLATAAKNISAAYSRALAACGYLMGLTGDLKKYKYSLNTDFPASRLTPNERAQLISEWQTGAITLSEMRAGMRRAGVATLDEVEYKAELEKNPPPEQVKMEAEQKAAKEAAALKTPPNAQQGQAGAHLNKGDGGGNQAGS